MAKKVKVNEYLEDLDNAMGFLFFDTPEVILGRGLNDVKIEVDCKVMKGHLGSKAAYDLVLLAERVEIEDLTLHPIDRDVWVTSVERVIRNLPLTIIEQFVDQSIKWFTGNGEITFTHSLTGVFSIQSSNGQRAIIAKKGHLQLRA